MWLCVGVFVMAFQVTGTITTHTLSALQSFSCLIANDDVGTGCLNGGAWLSRVSRANCYRSVCAALLVPLGCSHIRKGFCLVCVCFLFQVTLRTAPQQRFFYALMSYNASSAAHYAPAYFYLSWQLTQPAIPTPLSSPTSSPSSSLSYGASPSTSPSPSVSATPSLTRTPSASSTLTSSATPTPTSFPSVTGPTALACLGPGVAPFAAVLYGARGVFVGTTVGGWTSNFSTTAEAAYAGDTSGEGGGIFAADPANDVCGGPAPVPWSLYAPKAMLSIDLGPDVSPDWSLTLDLCAGSLYLPLWDTAMFVGTGCPTDFVTWSCVGSDDDSCGSSGFSRISLASLPTRVLYVVVTAYSTMNNPLTAGQFGLTWTASPPSPSVTPGITPPASPTRSSSSSTGGGGTSGNAAGGGGGGGPPALSSSLALFLCCFFGAAAVCGGCCVYAVRSRKKEAAAQRRFRDAHPNLFPLPSPPAGGSGGVGRTGGGGTPSLAEVDRLGAGVGIISAASLANQSEAHNRVVVYGDRPLPYPSSLPANGGNSGAGSGSLPRGRQLGGSPITSSALAGREATAEVANSPAAIAAAHVYWRGTGQWSDPFSSDGPSASVAVDDDGDDGDGEVDEEAGRNRTPTRATLTAGSPSPALSLSRPPGMGGGVAGGGGSSGGPFSAHSAVDAVAALRAAQRQWVGTGVMGTSPPTSARGGGGGGSGSGAAAYSASPNATTIVDGASALSSNHHRGSYEAERAVRYGAPYTSSTIGRTGRYDSNNDVLGETAEYRRSLGYAADEQIRYVNGFRVPPRRSTLTPSASVAAAAAGSGNGFAVSERSRARRGGGGRVVGGGGQGRGGRGHSASNSVTFAELPSAPSSSSSSTSPSSLSTMQGARARRVAGGGGSRGGDNGAVSVRSASLVEPRSFSSSPSGSPSSTPDGDAAAEDSSFPCSFCLGECVAPVTVACGHSFCKACLTDWIVSQKAARKPPLCPMRCAPPLPTDPASLRVNRDLQRAIAANTQLRLALERVNAMRKEVVDAAAAAVAAMAPVTSAAAVVSATPPTRSTFTDDSDTDTDEMRTRGSPTTPLPVAVALSAMRDVTWADPPLSVNHPPVAAAPTSAVSETAAPASLSAAAAAAGGGDTRAAGVVAVSSSSSTTALPRQSPPSAPYSSHRGVAAFAGVDGRGGSSTNSSDSGSEEEEEEEEGDGDLGGGSHSIWATAARVEQLSSLQELQRYSSAASAAYHPPGPPRPPSFAPSTVSSGSGGYSSLVAMGAGAPSLPSPLPPSAPWTSSVEPTTTASITRTAVSPAGTPRSGTNSSSGGGMIESSAEGGDGGGVILGEGRGGVARRLPTPPTAARRAAAAQPQRL